MKHTHVTLVALGLLLLGAACQKTTTTNQPPPAQNANSGAAVNENTNTASTQLAAAWSFNGSSWSSLGIPPACPNPLAIQTPVNLSLASAILYPGQTRGGNYKAHGGFLFRGKSNSDITVSAPVDAAVYNASRYIEQGETQYLFTFIHPCGLAYRFDHLLTLSPAMQAIADSLPPAQVDNSATTMITSGTSVSAGDTIAIAVGFQKTNNVSVDFGVYDLRAKNTAAANASYANSHSAEYAQHALCWLDLLPVSDATTAKALPGGDGAMGTTSDYCQ